MRVAVEHSSRAPNALIKTVVLDSSGFEVPHHFGLFGKELGDGSLGRVNHVMTLMHGDMAIHLQVKFHENAVARITSSKIVHTTNASTGDGGRFDALALRLRQFRIQKLARGSRCDTPGVRNHAEGDNERSN